MKTLFSVFSIVALLVIVYAFQKNDNSDEDARNSIGDVKYSVLPPDLFNKSNGPGWMLLDGSSIANTALGKVVKNIPDARGMFIRGMNIQNDISVDPDGYRKNYEKQNDAVGNLTFTSTIFDNGKKVQHTKTQTSNSDEDRDGIPYAAKGGSSDFSIETICSNCSTETRPKNIPLYVYVKVN